MIDHAISKLVQYALDTGLIEKSEYAWAVNAILEVLQRDSYTDPRRHWEEIDLSGVLEELTDDACARGVVKENSVVYRDLFDTALMGRLTRAAHGIAGMGCATAGYGNGSSLCHR